MNIIHKDECTTLIQGDCLKVMDELIKQGVKFDAIITDPPYGTTACKWDSIILFDEMWKRLKLLRNDNTPIVLFGGEPFSSALRMSNINEYKYDWIWSKTKPSNFLNCKKQPMRKYENVSVFYKKQSEYFPQGLILTDKQNKNSCKENTYGKVREFKQDITYTNYPHNILEFANIVGGNCLHPTQKPVELLEYLIHTYTNENDLILDFTCGSGSTLVASLNTKRRCIGIELDENYCEIAKNRILTTSLN